MWFRKSGGIIASPTQDNTPNHPSPEDQVAESQLTPNANSDSIVDMPVSYNNSGDNTGGQSLTHFGSSAESNHAMDSLHSTVDTAPQENVTSLFLDPSFSAPDLTLDFDWLFENVPSGLASNIDEGLPEVVSPARTSSSGISPPSFPMNSHTIRFPVPSDAPPFTPWVIVQGRLFEVLNTLPQAVLASPFFLPSNLSYFFDIYFENYHPHFPILHRPTLDPTTAPALLIAAIVTLGSTLASDGSHFETAVQIHDSLRYVIFNVR